MPPFHFVLVFAFSCRPPAMMMACGRVLTLVFLVVAPAFSFNSPFFVLPLPRHAGGSREVFDGRLSYHSAFFVSPPRHAGGTREFLWCFALISRLRFLNYFSSRFSWLHSQAVQRGEWVLWSRIFDSWSS